MSTNFKALAMYQLFCISFAFHLIPDHLLDFIVGIILITPFWGSVASVLVDLHFINLLMAEGGVIFQPKHGQVYTLNLSLYSQSPTQVVGAKFVLSIYHTGG